MIMRDKALEHLLRLTDDTGILRQGKNGVPDPTRGYATDDNARALLVAVMLYEKNKEEKYRALIYRYLSFLLFCQKKDGSFRNRLAYDRRFYEEDGMGDCLGCCLWALGYAIASMAAPAGVKATCREMFRQALPHLAGLESPRSKAYAIVGLSCPVQEEELEARLEKLADSLVRQYKLYSYDDWNWFEDMLAYGNAVFPLALFRAYRVLRSPEYLKTALDSLAFLERIIFKNGYFKPIGTNGWLHRGGEPAEFDEMPLEAAETALAYLEGFNLFKEKKYLEKARLCLAWFEGHNSQGAPLIDAETGGCYDAITAEGFKSDQGAESIISYCLSFLALQRYI